MQRYESYKPSAIPWITELPQHWGEEKGKWLHRFRKDLNNRKQCDNVLSLTLRGVVNNDPDNPEGLVPKDYGSYQIFEKNDLVFKLIDLENFRTSRVGLVHERGIMSPAYLRVQPGKEHNPRYFYYYYFTLYQQGIYNKLGAGVRSTLGPTDLLEIGVPVPSKEEQDRIVVFLDQKTAEIDAAISKKERLIELVQEQKAALIKASVLGHHLEERKHQSLIPWAEKLPAHWKMKRAKYLFRQSRLPVKPKCEVVTAYRDGQVTLRSNRRLDGYTFAILEQGYQGVMPGQLVINSMDAFAGAIGVSDSEGKCSPEYVVCDAINGDEISPSFAALVLRQMALSGYIEVICSAVRQRALRIRYNDFSPLFLPVPPMEEQMAIEKLVSDIRKHHDQMVLHLRQEISELKVFLGVVIADVATGQIKV